MIDPAQQEAREDRGVSGRAAGSATLLENSSALPMASSVIALLSGASSARFAVGYLFVEGLAPLAAALAEVERIDLLIGNVVNRLTEEQMREAAVLPMSDDRRGSEDVAALYREKRNRAAAETALNLRRTIDALPHTDTNRALLIDLARWILEGRLRVRVYIEQRLHAKVALACYPAGHPHSPGRAIVGTSNFTMLPEPSSRGAAAQQSQPSSNIDVLMDGQDNFDQLNGWFDWHWSEAQNFQRELFEELGRAWPLSQS